MKTNLQVLNEISAKLEGEDNATSITEALNNIANALGDNNPDEIISVSNSLEDILSVAGQGGGGGGGITPAIKTALLGCFSKVAWVDENGQDYYDTLLNAMYSPADLSSISAVYSGGSVSADTSLDSLKTDLVVTAHWSDSSTSTVGASYYELSGTLTVGTSTVTVAYLGKTTTFNLIVTPGEYTMLSYIEADGSSYINTNFTPDQNTKVTIDYMSLKASGESFQSPLGVTSDTGTTANGKGFFFFIGSANDVSVYVADTNAVVKPSGVTVGSGDRHTYSFTSSDYSIDGVSYGHPYDLSGQLTASVGYPFYAFARNHGNNNVRAMCTGRIYEINIYSSGSLAKHYVPVYKNSTGKYGLLETIGNIFYGNSGSGTISGA